MKASYDYYGRIAVDSQSLSRTNAGTKLDIANNESKLGLKGNFALGGKSETKIIYQIEYGIDLVDGKARGDDGTLKKRNTYVGIQYKLGTLFVGTHDSAFKKAQLKVDLFNDLAPDIKNVLHGENRLEDFIGYITPKYQGVFSATFNSIKNSKLLITDLSNIAFTYAFTTEQPVIFFSKNENKLKSDYFSKLYFFKDRKKIGAIVENVSKLVNIIRKNSLNKVHIYNNIISLRKNRIEFFGSAVKRTANEINKINQH